MTAERGGQGEGSGLAAALGWGGIVLFGALFVWFVTRQLSDEWENREAEAVGLVRQLRPQGGRTIEDRMRARARARQSQVFIGLFHWQGRHVDGPRYEVKLTWKEGEANREATWRADLKTREVEAADVAAAGIMALPGAQSSRPRGGGRGGPR